MRRIKHAPHMLIMSWQRVHDFTLYAHHQQIFCSNNKEKVFSLSCVLLKLCFTWHQACCMERTWQRLLSMAIWEMEAAWPVISPTCLLVLPCHSRMSLSSPPLAHRLKALLWAKQCTPLLWAVTVCRTLHLDRSVILIVLSREHVTKPSSCMLDTCCSIYGSYTLV